VVSTIAMVLPLRTLLPVVVVLLPLTLLPLPLVAILLQVTRLATMVA
jgi:hypothetical protein